MCKQASLLIRLALASVGVGIATGAHAQVSPDNPKAFVWSNGIPCNYTPHQDDSMVAMARLWLNYNTTPVAAANYIADYIYEHTRTSPWTNDPGCYGAGSHAPDLDPSTSNNTICITLQNFGADTTETSGSEWFASPLRFFTEEDRLPNYIEGALFGTYSYSDATFGFPVENAWKRTYRHPFLWNAGFPRTEHPVPSPLREWMQEFVKQYRIRQGQDSTLPDPSRFYFDVETPITWPGSMNEVSGHWGDDSANFVRILEQIYDSRREIHRQNGRYYTNYWSDPNVPVPGDPLGRNLRQIYLDDKVKFDLPTTGSGSGEEPDLSELTSNSGTLQSPVPVPGSDSVNRKIMLWWAEVCQRATEQVMKHCLYDVIHDGFIDGNDYIPGWPDAKVGNYNATTNDGLYYNAGVVADSTCGPTDNSCWLADITSRRSSLHVPDPQTTGYIQNFPSCTGMGDIDTVGTWPIAPAYTQDGLPGQRHWGTIVQTALGDIDSPVLYPVGFPYEYLRGRNPYARKVSGLNLPESRYDLSMRLMRQSLESAEGARRGEGINTRPVVPWFYMSGLTVQESATAPPRVIYSTFELSQLLAMVRAKRLPELIAFNSYRLLNPIAGQYPRVAPNPDTQMAWARTEQALEDVYAAKVRAATYTNSSGTETQTDDANELAKIEETLTDVNHAPRTIDVHSRLLSGQSASRATVTVKFADRHGTTPPPPTENLSRLVAAGYDFLVNLECTTWKTVDGALTPDPDVEIFVTCRMTDGTMLALASFDGETKVSTGRNGFAVTRCTWYAPNSARLIGEARIDPSYIVIDAVGTGAAPTHAFQVKVDLLQVIPYVAESARLYGAGCVPAVNLATNSRTNPITVDSIMLPSPSLQGALRVAWDRPITIEPEPGMTNRPYYARVYLFTGTSTNPLADVTCVTHQVLESGDSSVVIRYSAAPGEPDRAFPPGLYKVSTFTQGAAVQTQCAAQAYARLRTKIAEGMPIEGDPPVKSEDYWFKVAFSGSVNPGPIPPGCPPAPAHCNRGAETCVADVDDGTGTGVPDGGVTIDDLIYYLVIFEAGTDCADVDDGSFTGCLDGGGTIDDLLYFLFRFEAGC